MADNLAQTLSVSVQLTTNVAGALIRRFVSWETSSPGFREVITAVPNAAGKPAPVGILAESIDTTQADGFYISSMVLPNCITEVLLGENCTQGAPLRCGGSTSEVDGAAYLANASNDFIVAYALRDGTAGEIVNIHFTGYYGLF